MCMQRSCAHERGTQDGFVLVETLVAFAVFALTMGVVLQIAADAARRTGQARSLSQANVALQSLLGRVGVDIPLEPGEPKGQFGDGLRWRLRIERFGEAADRQAWPVGAYSVAVEVSWRDGSQVHSVAATTLRLGPRGTTP